MDAEAAEIIDAIRTAFQDVQRGGHLARMDEQPDSMERFRQLTPAQSRIVARFLRYMGRHADYADDVVANQAEPST